MPGPAALTPSAIAGAGPQTGAAAAASAQGHRFQELLSELNPLQYLPVAGPIYRAVTGDSIPEPVRVAGSFVVSGLLGGPVGMALNLAAFAAEKLTGIDPEQIEQYVLASVGIGHHSARAPTAAGPAGQAAALPAAVATAAPDVVDVAQPASLAWSPTRLAAYGVITNSAGTLTQGALQGSDVLNEMELVRLRAASPTLPPERTDLRSTSEPNRSQS